jgi:hypothetical protein
VSTIALTSGPASPRAVPARIVAARIQQGRQDLNLQPAVLETAALPVELRPFAGWQANLLVPGLPLCAVLLRIASLCIVVGAHNARALHLFD